MLIFSWDEWNTRHIAKHHVARDEAEWAVRPFPREIGDDKFVVWGRTGAGRYLQVIFVFRSEGDIEYASMTLAELMGVSDDEHPVIVYVIHAMNLTATMLSQYRRLRRRER